MKNKLEFDIACIIEEYSNYVFKIVDNTSGNTLDLRDKEEIVSDAFYLLWKNQEHIHTNLKSYLGAIARNCTYDKLKNSKLEFEFKDELNAEYKKDLDNLIAIKTSLELLSIEERELFSLFYIDGLKIKEIAKIQRKSIGNVKVCLHRLRKKLKEELKDD